MLNDKINRSLGMQKCYSENPIGGAEIKNKFAEETKYKKRIIKKIVEENNHTEEQRKYSFELKLEEDMLRIWRC